MIDVLGSFGMTGVAEDLLDQRLLYKYCGCKLSVRSING